MSVGPAPEPSLLLARQENAHREHLQHHHLHQHQHRNHQHQHQHPSAHHAQKRDVTTAVVTVSYLQEINVDPEGNTFIVQTLLPAPTQDVPPLIDILTSAIPSAIESALLPLVTGLIPPSLLPSQSALPPLTSAPSVPASFASLIANSNSTTSPLISGASNTTTTHSQSTTISSSSKSSATLVLSSSTSLESTSAPSSTWTPTSSLNFSPETPPAGIGGYGGGPSNGASKSAPSSTAASGNGGSSGSAPSTPVVVGSVVASVAGLAIVAAFLLFLVRWRKQKNMLSLGNGNDGTAMDAVTPREGPSEPSGGMVQRRSIAFAVPAALASLTGYSRRVSQKTERAASSTAGSERGFYRVSGRKLPSVLHTGGDGYGGGIHDSLSGSSFYRDSTGFYGGPSQGPAPSSPRASPIGISVMDRDSGVPVMRPGPARTPVTEHGPFLSTPSPPPPRRPDGLGRSRPSQDGSHGSRFTEEV